MNIRAGLFFLLFLSGVSFAHEEHAKEPQKQSNTAITQKEIEAQFNAINESYKENVKPIFQRSCFDCHSQSPRLPWYHSLPLVHDLLENDMKEAKVHLDFSNDFPFKGHGTTAEDLKAIAKTIEDKNMPPFRYKIMHWNSALNEEEIKIILNWVSESQKILNSPKKE